jgi:hypothetical protein
MDTATDRDLLRHALATLAYRAAKALRDTPDDFGDFRVGPTSRTPTEILGHMGDLMAWALRMAEDGPAWAVVESPDWAAHRSRFFETLGALDAYLESDAPLAHEPAKLLQGPIADALTHVGQIAMLRRLAGAAVRGENYFKAIVQTGRVGSDQAAPVYEFD